MTARCSVLASGNSDDDLYRCIHDAAAEWLSTSGEWESICGRHALGLGIPADRLRPLQRRAALAARTEGEGAT